MRGGSKARTIATAAMPCKNFRFSFKISLDWRVCVRIVLMGSEDCLLRVTV